MQIKSVMKILGLLLIIFSITIIIPIIVSIIYQDNQAWYFFITLIITLATGLMFWIPAVNYKVELKLRDGFIIVSLIWLILSFFGALPFIMSESLKLSNTNAVFESISGLTTTGSTILNKISGLPESILFYRQFLQWLGGLGIVVLVVAIFPILGSGGMLLYKAEAGSIKKKVTPRITETAKWLWVVYVTLTIFCSTMYFIAGMNIFDSICHSLSTISTGGFSTRNESFGFYDNQWIELVAIFFMIAGSLNFSLHYLALKNKSISPYRNDTETFFFIFLIILLSTLIILYTYNQDGVLRSREIIAHSFNAVSILTSTGFTNSTYNSYLGFVPLILILFSFIGGCAGSTTGGMKTIRVVLLAKNSYRQLKKLIHPNSKIKIKFSNTVISDKTIEIICVFFTMYIFFFLTALLLLMFSGLDFLTSFSAVAAAINNVGAGHGEVLYSCESLSDFNKWILCFIMIIGRLEIFTLLVIFTPDFWKK